MANVAVIPARSGSKRLPNKNLMELSGKSLVEIAVEQAVLSGVFSAVFVSTDSQKILDQGLGAGAEPLPLRSAELSGDTTTSHQVVLDLVSRISERYAPQYVYTLPPTAPFRSASNISEAHGALVSSKEATGVLSCVRVPHRFAVEKQMVLGKDGTLTALDGIFPAAFESTILEKRFSRNAAIYGVAIDYLHFGLAGPRPVPYLMSPLDSVDIDTLEDFELASAVAFLRWKAGKVLNE